MSLLLDVGNAICDGLSWAEALLIRISTPMSSNTNEHGVLIHTVLNPTTAGTSYEKDTLQVWTETHDDCDFTKGIDKFAVALDVRATIGGTSQSGWAQAAYFEAGSRTGCDGQMPALELGGNNNGTENPIYGTPKAKHLLQMVAGENPGNKNLTCAFSCAGGTAKFFNGGIFERTAFVPGAPILRLIDNATGKDIFAVLEDGTLRYSKLEQIP